MNSIVLWPAPGNLLSRRSCCHHQARQGLGGSPPLCCPPPPSVQLVSRCSNSNHKLRHQAAWRASRGWWAARHAAASHQPEDHHPGSVALRHTGSPPASPAVLQDQASAQGSTGQDDHAAGPTTPAVAGTSVQAESDAAGSSSSCDSSDSDCSSDEGSSSSNKQQQQQPVAAADSSRQGLFSLPSVPWGRGKIVQVMVLWLLAYIIIGQVAVPMALCVAGLDRDALGLRGHAVLHLCLDLSQLGVTLAILWGCLKKYRPRARGLFPMSWSGWWPLVVLAACVVFPGVDWIAQQSLSWFPLEAAESWTNQMESSLSVGDWITNVAYFSVVSICAPIWEEAIFRGFLLTSLGRYMSPQWAVAVSSLLFAMCHFRLQTFLPLLILGVVFSFVFLLTRNLVPPMVLHSVWNVFVLANLLLRPG